MEEETIALEKEILTIRLLNRRIEAAMGANLEGTLAAIQTREKIDFWQELEAEYSAKKRQETQAIERFYDEKIDALPEVYRPDRAGMSYEEKMRSCQVWLQTATEKLNRDRRRELSHVESRIDPDVQRCQQRLQEAREELELERDRWEGNGKEVRFPTRLRA